MYPISGDVSQEEESRRGTGVVGKSFLAVVGEINPGRYSPRPFTHTKRIDTTVVLFKVNTSFWGNGRVDQFCSYTNVDLK